MKKQLTLSVLATLFLCGTAMPDDQETLQESLKKWQTVRDKSKGNYSYKVRWSSFAGFGHETEVFIEENKVSKRRFREFSNRPQLIQPGQPAPKKSAFKWVETGDDLGKHKEGAPPKTLDELYAEAGEVLKRELPAHERRYLRFDKQGLLLACYTVDTRIADDAPLKGVVISSISVNPGGKVYKAPNGKPFPAHWGPPPRIQTRDLRPLPGGYGRGSGTLARWIQMNLDKDAKKKGREG